MTEEKKFTAREGFQEVNAEFIGLASKPLTGEKDGKTWTKSKVKFKAVGRDNEWNFTIWSPLNSEKSKYKTLDELEQFKIYHILWTEKDESWEGKEWVSKTIQIINDEGEIKPKTQSSSSSGSDNTSNKTQVSSGTTPLSQSEVDKLYVKLSVFNDAFKEKLQELGKMSDYTKEQFVSSAYVYLREFEANAVIKFFEVQQEVKRMTDPVEEPKVAEEIKEEPTK